MITAAALIWTFIKLPQEYWIHIPQMDITDWIGANPSNALILAAWAIFLLCMARWLIRDLPPARQHLEIKAIPVAASRIFFSGPGTINKSRENLINGSLIEKIALVSLITIIFGQILPGVRASNLRLTTAWLSSS